MPGKMLSNNYGYEIQNGYRGVYEDLVHYVGIHDRTPALEQHMEHLTVFNMTLNKHQQNLIPSGSHKLTSQTLR